MKVGDVAYIVESNKNVREVEILRYSGGLFLVPEMQLLAENNGLNLEIKGINNRIRKKKKRQFPEIQM